MAKSIRSKWKRKMRAIKRVRYGEKELERLKKTVGADPEIKKENIDEVMKNSTDQIEPLVKIVNVKEIKSQKSKKPTKNEESEETMDDDTVVHKYNSKTMKDQFGSYPVWMNQRKISKKKKARKGRPKRK